MKTKSADPVPTFFPTCGEVFEFLINGLDLPAWRDLFTPGTNADGKQIDKERSGRISDNLRDWATEHEGRVPSYPDFEKFIREHTDGLPASEELCSVLTSLIGHVMAEHANTVRENATYLGRVATRAWYGRGKAPDALYLLYQFRKLLLRITGSDGPMLAQPLADLLTSAWRDDAPLHPLVAACLEHYSATAQNATADNAPEWRAGVTRPTFRSLGDYLRGHDRLPEIMLNLGVAHLVEALSVAFTSCVPAADLRVARQLLIQQAHSLAQLDTILAAKLPEAERYALADYGRYLADQVIAFRKEVVAVVSRGDEALLDLRWANLRCHRDYYLSFSRAVPPLEFNEFCRLLSGIWNNTRLSAPPGASHQAGVTLGVLRRDYTQWCEPLEGPLLAIEARLILLQEKSPTSATFLNACDRYQEAVAKSRYRAGSYTRTVLREALGLAALIQRGGVAEGARLLPWINNTLAWWDLIGLGNDYDHEQQPQRVERAEREFIDGLNQDLRQRWRRARPLPALDHYYLGGLFGFIEPEALARTEEPVDKRQKKPFRSAATGRDQSPLMEVIDRRDLVAASALVGSGADLNFVNSTGDNCVTKAFACEAYDLVLEILRREEKPILRSVLLRETNKNQHNALELAVSHGRVDVLRELAKWKQGRGDLIDFDEERILGGQTLLYYSVMLLAVHRMTPEAFVNYIVSMDPTSETGKFACAMLQKNPKSREWMKLLKEHTQEHGYAKGWGLGRPDLVAEVIAYLIDEADVDIDTTCTKGHTGFTLAVENRMHDIAFRLLSAGSNVNHRCNDGATALCFAIRNDDYEMARLLHEHRADDRLFVEAMGRPINAMEMSERIRQIYPRRI